MTNTQYQLTAKIHELLPQINQKYGLKIEVKPASYQYKGNNEDGSNKYEPIYDFGEKQIRQILVGLKEVLGESEATITARDAFQSQQEKIAKYPINALDYDDALTLLFSIRSFVVGEYPKSQAKALYQRWLGFNGLYFSEPKTVLTELVEILENLLK